MVSILIATASLFISASQVAPVQIGSSERSARLLNDMALESDYRPARHPMLRLTDDWRLLRGDAPVPLDDGGGMSSDVRQILALVLGFIPGFGLGHLVARDKNGFLLFLIIDAVLYVVGGIVGGVIWHSALFWPIGGLVWLVIHIFQALDAYGAAGGERLVEDVRSKAVRIAGNGRPEDAPLTTTGILRLSF